MIKSWILSATAFYLLGSSVLAGQVLQFNPASNVGSFSQHDTLGWSFTTNAAITVTALDAFDPSGTGLVQLYGGTGNLLASATLTTADAQEGSPVLFYTQAITPVSLAAGQTYYIAQDLTNNLTQMYTTVVGLTTNPSITWDGAVVAVGLGQRPTIDLTQGGFNPGFFGPNFDIGTGTPEPSTLLMGLSSLAVLALLGIRRKQTR